MEKYFDEHMPWDSISQIMEPQGIYLNCAYTVDPSGEITNVLVEDRSELLVDITIRVIKSMKLNPRFKEGKAIPYTVYRVFRRNILEMTDLFDLANNGPPAPAVDSVDYGDGVMVPIEAGEAVGTQEEIPASFWDDLTTTPAPESCNALAERERVTCAKAYLIDRLARLLPDSFQPSTPVLLSIGVFPNGALLLEADRTKDPTFMDAAARIIARQNKWSSPRLGNRTVMTTMRVYYGGGE